MPPPLIVVLAGPTGNDDNGEVPWTRARTRLTALANDHDGRDVRDVNISGVVFVVVIAVVPGTPFRPS
jgi:hypothetical protein